MIAGRPVRATSSTTWLGRRARDEEDPLFADVPVYEGGVPPDLSDEHDAYLYADES